MAQACIFYHLYGMHLCVLLFALFERIANNSMRISKVYHETGSVRH